MFQNRQDTMNITHIQIDDTNPLHRELPIYRTGSVGAVRLSDAAYQVYDTLDINAHDMAALFHYGVVEALNSLRFISESDNGLDSWDEAFLPAAQIGGMVEILEGFLPAIAGRATERVLLGWQDDPEKIAYWRSLDPERAAAFVGELRDFACQAAANGHDLEFIL